VIALSLEEVAELCPGRLEAAARAREVSGVQIDSRRIADGDLFVAVDGGRDFVEHALACGAAAALVPEDPHRALAALAGAVRARSAARVVAITGSTGKTSTKDILAAVCEPRARTVAAEASYNNELGVPLTLCRLEPNTEICILELAMRGLGQIAHLAAIARPHIGAIVTVGPAHLELVGSLDNVVRAKGELLDALPAGGTAIVPEGFPVRRTDLEIVVVGEPSAQVREGRTLIRFEGREVSFDFASRHQARNALVALHAARALGLEVEGAVDVAFSRWRGDETELPGGGLLVNDAYNANPISMRAALEHLTDRARGRRTVAVLGDMAELGEESPRYHRELGELCARLGLGALVAVGPLSRETADAAESAGVAVVRRAGDVEDALRLTLELLEPGDCVLVKASRAAGLEAVADGLAIVRT
jgi:UDP-N-acetylmuramoyl-tripeptide--D-alanyl-D-alanine ligase